jgi:hypothetical protein
MALSVTNVPFHDSTLYIVKHYGKPYVPMKPVVEGMGMDWQRQRAKLKGQFYAHIKTFTIKPSVDSQPTTFLCLALDNFSDWMQTVCPNKVKSKIRDKVIQYQCECLDQLHKGWAKGESKQIPTSASEERTSLQTAVNRIVSKYGLPYQAIYKLIHRKFGTKHSNELTERQNAEAIDHLLAKVLDGELLGKQDGLPPPSRKTDYNYPVETADPHDRKFGNAWMTPRVILDERNRAPEQELLEALEKDGFDVTGAKIRIHAMYGITQQFIEMQKELSYAQQLTSRLNNVINNQTKERGANIIFSGEKKGLAYGGYPKRRLD